MTRSNWKLAKALWPKPGSPNCEICNERVDGEFYYSPGGSIAHKDCVDNDVQPGNNRDDNFTWSILSDISANMAQLVKLETERNDMLREMYAKGVKGVVISG